MKIAVAQGLLNSHSYTKYRSIIADLMANGKVSGHQQSEDLLLYTQLNETRMNRLVKNKCMSASFSSRKAIFNSIC